MRRFTTFLIWAVLLIVPLIAAPALNASVHPVQLTAFSFLAVGMLAPIRAALDYLDNIFAAGGAVSRELWYVLTALRGGDDPGADINKAKDGDLEHSATTEVIRSAAFPRTARAGWTPGGAFALAGTAYVPSTTYVPHFTDHLFRAAYVLGLVNDRDQVPATPAPPAPPQTVISNIQQ